MDCPSLNFYSCLEAVVGVLTLGAHVGGNLRGGDCYRVQVCCSDDDSSAAELLAWHYCGERAETDVGGDPEVVGHGLGCVWAVPEELYLLLALPPLLMMEGRWSLSLRSQAG